MAPCPRCRTALVIVSDAVAATWYAKLRPYLRVVPSFGCYTPTRGAVRAGNCAAWPRHAWAGPGRFPLVVAWRRPDDGAAAYPTFAQFARAYGLTLCDADGGTP